MAKYETDTWADALAGLKEAEAQVPEAEKIARGLRRRAERLKSSANTARDLSYQAALSALLEAHAAGTIGDSELFKAIVEMRQHKPSRVISQERFSPELLVQQFEALELGEPVIGTERFVQGSRAVSENLFGGVLVESPVIEAKKCAGEISADVALALEWLGHDEVIKTQQVKISYSGFGAMAIGTNQIQAFLDNETYRGREPRERSGERLRLEHVGSVVERVEATGIARWDYTNINHLVDILTPRRHSRSYKRRYMDWAPSEVRDIELANMQDLRRAAMHRLLSGK